MRPLLSGSTCIEILEDMYFVDWLSDRQSKPVYAVLKEAKQNFLRFRGNCEKPIPLCPHVVGEPPLTCSGHFKAVYFEDESLPPAYVWKALRIERDLCG